MRRQLTVESGEHGAREDTGTTFQAGLGFPAVVRHSVSGHLLRQSVDLAVDVGLPHLHVAVVDLAVAVSVASDTCAELLAGSEAEGGAERGQGSG